MTERVRDGSGRCPNCANKIVQKSGSETRLRVSHPIYFDADGRCLARCHWCKAEVEIPVELRAIDLENERFTIPTT